MFYRKYDSQRAAYRMVHIPAGATHYIFADGGDDGACYYTFISFESCTGNLYVFDRADMPKLCPMQLEVAPRVWLNHPGVRKNLWPIQSLYAAMSQGRPEKLH